MLYVGVDPGEVYTGLALLHVHDRYVHMESRVLKSDKYVATAECIRQTIDCEKRRTIVVEDFSVRPTGYNRFTRAETVRLIGALEYIAHVTHSPFYFQPAGKPKEAYALFGRSLTQHAKSWPSNRKWTHALSAWRVMGRYLHAERKSLFQLHTVRIQNDDTMWLPNYAHPLVLLRAYGTAKFFSR